MSKDLETFIEKLKNKLLNSQKVNANYAKQNTGEKQKYYEGQRDGLIKARNIIDGVLAEIKAAEEVKKAEATKKEKKQETKKDARFKDGFTSYLPSVKECEGCEFQNYCEDGRFCYKR